MTAQAPAAPRFDASIPAFFFGGRVEGQGTIRDVSKSGALIQSKDGQLRAGMKLTIEVGLASEVQSIRVAGEVVRIIKGGFAVRFYFDSDREAAIFEGMLDMLVSRREVLARK